MPIKGVSERQRLPRLGKIHLGLQVPVMKDGKPVIRNGEPVTRPKATDYFVFTEDRREELEAIFGENPKSLDIIIPVADPDVWASQFYRCYSRTRGLVCRGDGETCDRLVDVDTGDIAGRDTKDSVWQKGQPCAGRECPDYKDKKRQCRETMNLQFMLPDAPGLGIWQIDTGSINSIININSCAAMIKSVAGRVHMIPLQLTLEPIDVVNPDDHKKKKVHVLNLRCETKLRQVLELAARPANEALMPPVADGDAPDDLLALPAGDDEIPDAAIARQEPETKTEFVIPDNIPAKDAAGLCTTTDISALIKFAKTCGVDPLVIMKMAQAKGFTGADWAAMSKKQIRWAAEKIVEEATNGNQGSGAKPTDGIDVDAGGPEAEPGGVDPVTAAADRLIDGAGDEPDDDGWDALAAEADAGREG